MRESETKLKTDFSRERASSAQLRDHLSRERTSNQQLASQVEQLSSRLRESTRLESGTSQHLAEQLQVNTVCIHAQHKYKNKVVTYRLICTLVVTIH